MALGGCLTCIKYTLFILNFVFWLVGCLLLAIGIWALVDPGPVKHYTHDREWEASIVISVMITVGSIMTIVGFLGCCGAIRESRCLLILFFSLLFVIHAIFITAGLFCMIKREKVSDWFPKPDKDKISKKLNAEIAKYETDAASKTFMDDIQNKYKCCGADTGIEDYRTVEHEHGDKICMRRTRKRPCTAVMLKSETEKHDTLMIHLPKYIVMVSAIVLAISILMIIGMILSIVLCCALKDEIINTY